MRSVFFAAALAVMGAVADVVYVTDLGLFTSLAPCAASAVSANVQGLTYSDCPEAVTELQSCVCTKNNNLAEITTGISSSVSYSCGGTASDDLESAYTVLSAYCNQDRTINFNSPDHPVSAYITDLPTFEDLAPCAGSALSYAVLGMTYDECPEQPTLLAPCVCSRNQNSLKVSQIINTSVKYSCDSHSADVTSAQALFAAYCDMNDGTTKLPTTSGPPGDMTYYITALTQYGSLAPCAQRAISNAFYYASYSYCPSGPQGLASCACIKESMSTSMTSSMISNVKYYCDETASEDISSALGVFGYYCSAARSEVVAAGITESVAEPSATGDFNGDFGGSDGPEETGSNGGSSSGDGDGGSSGSSSKVPMVAGIAGAVVAVLLIAGIVAFFIMKRRRAANNGFDPNSPSNPSNPAMAGIPPMHQHNARPSGQTQPGEFVGTAELGGAEVKPTGQFGFSAPLAPSSPSPSTAKMGASRVDNVSPVSAHSNVYPPPTAVEMSGNGNVPPVPQVPELGGHHSPSPQQQPGQQYGFQQPPNSVHEAPNTQQPPNGLYEAPNTPQPQNPLYEAPNTGIQGQGFPQPPPAAMMPGQHYPQQPFGQPQYGQPPYGQTSPYGQYPGQQHPGAYGQPGYGQGAPPPAELGGYASPQQYMAELSNDGSRARGMPGQQS